MFGVSSDDYVQFDNEISYIKFFIILIFYPVKYLW